MNSLLDTLYSDAKKAYDSILKPFLEEPIVYKIESTKKVLHKQYEDIYKDIADPNLLRIQEYLDEPVPILDEKALGHLMKKYL